MVASSTRDWLAIRKDFESCGLSIRKFAQERNIPLGTLRHRYRNEAWIQGRRLVKASVHALEKKIEARVQHRLEHDLAPFIEREKTKFTKAGLKIAKRGLKRTESYFEATPVTDPKMDAFIAKAATDWHRMGRVALGMGDGSPVAGSVNLNILTNQATISASEPKANP